MALILILTGPGEVRKACAPSLVGPRKRILGSWGGAQGAHLRLALLSVPGEVRKAYAPSLAGPGKRFWGPEVVRRARAPPFGALNCDKFGS